jgi:glycosyltransferase involved in cell wall biosynthesis
MRVNIGVMCYNESKSIPAIIQALAEVRNSLSTIDLRVLLINNGSTDSTGQLIEEIEKQNEFVHHITIPVNQGYGYGVRMGLNHLSGDVVGFMWGDNQFDASVIKPMIQTFIDKPDVQLVKTFRTKRYDGSSRLLVSKIYQIIFRILYGVYTHDINSGPKLFRSEFLKKLQPLRSDDWFIDAELMIKATRNCRSNQVVEFPITFYPRQFGKSNVKFSACFQFLFNLIKYKFVKL